MKFIFNDDGDIFPVLGIVPFLQPLVNLKTNWLISWMIELISIKNQNQVSN